MISIDIETILTIIYVLVDDWYEEKGQNLLARKTARKLIFKDSEMITLIKDFLEMNGKLKHDTKMQKSENSIP